MTPDQTQTRVFKYGLLAPTVNADRVDDILFRAHTLYNDLITIWQERTRAYWDLDCDTVKKNTRAAFDLIAKRREIRDRINELRSSKPKDEGTALADLKAQIDALQAEGQTLTQQIDALWTENRRLRHAQYDDETYVQRVKALDKERTLKNNQTREASGLYWGTYNVVDRSAQQAHETSVKKGNGIPLRKPWTGEGQVAVQIQDHERQTWSSISDPKHTLVHIAPTDPRAFDPSVPKNQRRKLQRTVLKMRIASDEKGKPIFAEWPMILHRPLPDGARVTNLTVNRNKHANWDVWTVQLTVTLDATPKLAPDRVQKAVAIDVGWRSLPDGGLRVAYWADTEGNHGELALTPRTRDRFAYAHTKKGQRSENLDALLKGLKDDLHGVVDPALKEAIQYLPRWRAPRKFVRLLRKFADVLPVAARTRLEAWAKLDLHNWQTEFGTRMGVVRHRNDLYSVFAARLVSQYDLIVVEDFEVGNISKRAKPEKKKDTSNDFAAMRNAAARQRVEASAKTLVRILVSAAARTGTRIVEVRAAGTSNVHRTCGQKTKLGIEQIHTCDHCGTTFDRDENAAHNILDRGLTVLKDPTALAKADLVKPKRGPRFAARHVKPVEEAPGITLVIDTPPTPPTKDDDGEYTILSLFAVQPAQH